MEAWRCVHITTWEFEGNIRLKNWTEGRQASRGEEKQNNCRRSSTSQLRTVEFECQLEKTVVGKATADRRGSGWAAMENEKGTTLTAITLGSKYFSYVRSLAPSHMQTLSNPFRNLTNKARGKNIVKKVFLRLSLSLHLSACVVYFCVFIIVRLSNYCVVMMLDEVFLRLSLSLRLSACVVYFCVFIIVRLSNYCVVMMLHDAVDDYTTQLKIIENRKRDEKQ